MKAAIFCRVSGDKQEKEGTSLETQLEESLKYCQGKGYDVCHRFSGVESGLVLDRSMLNELRELVRNERIDTVVVYNLDRLSRDPTHGVIITQELEKHNVTLESVTEDVDNSELGKLISYIRGFASKLEAEKIKERTMRGKRARAREGRMPSGGGSNIYGYDYIKVSQANGGRRVINDIEASWVRQIYQWLVNEGLSSNVITYRLRDLNAPSKTGRIWNGRTVRAILTNPAYTGKFYAFTTDKGRKQFTRPQADWIEVEGVTPPIISQELFDSVQKQLQVNRVKTVSSTKYEYLLRGHIRCRQCGRAYTGSTRGHKRKTGQYHPYYRCSGKLRMNAPVERCHNRGWSSKRLDTMVWNELSHYLSDHDLIANELEKQRHDANHLDSFEAELQQVERQLKAVDHEQRQLLQWALKGFPEDQVEAENKRLNKARETLKVRRMELETQQKISHNATINVPNLERFIRDIQDKLPNLDFEGKRLALDMLGITVWIDGENVEITGTIDSEMVGTLGIQSGTSS